MQGSRLLICLNSHLKKGKTLGPYTAHIFKFLYFYFMVTYSCCCSYNKRAGYAVGIHDVGIVNEFFASFNSTNRRGRRWYLSSQVYQLKCYVALFDLFNLFLYVQKCSSATLMPKTFYQSTDWVMQRKNELGAIIVKY